MGVLSATVSRFTEELAPHLPSDAGPRLNAEARAIATIVIECDGRVTADELAALQELTDLPSPFEMGNPSALFRELLASDRMAAWTYLHRALDVATIAAALDGVASPEEVDAVTLLRRTLTDALGGVESSQAAPTVPDEKDAQPRPVEELLDELDNLIGLAGVKEEVRIVAALTKVEQMRVANDLPVTNTARHLVFTGNPGTGKTTVARLLAQIYKSLGVVSKGHLIETDRAGLVAGYVGQTALKVVEVVERAMGGVLLIDEAYALARGSDNDFGREAIDTLVKMMEDRRDELVIVLAGYPEEMQELLDTNPGLRSRLPKVINFADYTDDELVSILESMAAAGEYVLDAGITEDLRAHLALQHRTRSFGNARLVRNLFEAMVARQALRLSTTEEPTRQQLQTIVHEDLAKVLHG